VNQHTNRFRIAGTVVRVGLNVTSFQVGQKVGVGAQVDCKFTPQLKRSGRLMVRLACGKCKSCTSGFENYCAGIVQTYNSRYPSGEKAMGGYGSHWRGPARFVFAIPDGMDPAEVGPMLCGGITLYAPLKNNGCGPGKTVGIVGIGGLGHFGVLFAKALGADKVVAISRKSDKRDDALALGADEYVATGEDEQWAQKHADSLDLIISTVSHPNVSSHHFESGCV
jgi:alcohol dehydrogenase (NADP+)